MTNHDDTIAQQPDSRSLLRRLKARILPEMPDFYGLLIEQCEVVVAGTAALLQFLETSDPLLGRKVRKLEKQGDRLKYRNLQILHKSFATPMDREDIYRVVESIDEVLNYCKTTVVEMELLEVAADPHIVRMAALLNAGARSLLQALQDLEQAPRSADTDARAARKVERSIEKVYRAALQELFAPQSLQRELPVEPQPVGAGAADPASWQMQTLVAVTRMLKKREIYRHLSNAADHLSNAGQVIEDAISKST